MPSNWLTMPLNSSRRRNNPGVDIDAVAAIERPLPPGAGAPSDCIRLANTSLSNYGYLRVHDSPALEPQRFTVMAWFQPTGLGFGNTSDQFGSSIIDKASEGSSGNYLSSWQISWSPSTGKVNARIAHLYGSPGVTLESLHSFPMGSSVHVALTFDGAQFQLIINGAVEVLQTVPWSSIYYGSEDVLVGAGNFGSGYYRRFDGLVDEVQIWGRSFSVAEVQTTMNRRLCGNEPDLLGYWSFGAGSLEDQTANGNDAVAQGPGVSIQPEFETLTSGCLAVTSLCGGTSAPCPCGNFGLAGHGCDNAEATGGALLTASGNASVMADTLLLTADSLPSSAPTLFFQGRLVLNGGLGFPLGDGVRCAGGQTSRLGLKQAMNGVASYGATLGDSPVSVAGSVYAAGGTFVYQAWYRSPSAFCTAGTSNLSNALEIVWIP